MTSKMARKLLLTSKYGAMQAADYKDQIARVSIESTIKRRLRRGFRKEKLLR
jgi:hypothetical protein